jgi:hypothetical protein
MNLGTVFYTVRNFVKLKIGWTYSSNGETRSEYRITEFYGVLSESDHLENRGGGGKIVLR